MSASFVPHGSVCVVTGGGSGIGRALCRGLGQAGARAVVVVDVAADAAEQVAAQLHSSTPGVRALSLHLDVTNTGALAEAIDRIETDVGSIDLWCSNAGVHRGRGLGEVADWQTSVQVNLLAHVETARHLLPRMIARRCGHFVITASAAGLLSDIHSACYSASKHAAVALAEWLAIAHAGDNVSIACVCPEKVRTAMTRAERAGPRQAGGILEAEEVADHILTALREGCFLILPHARVAQYEQRRVADRPRWLKGMHALLLRHREQTVSSIESQGT